MEECMSLPTFASTDLTRLNDRIALVTGCGSVQGIGFASAWTLAARGAAVAITSTTDRIYARVRELTDAGFTAVGFIADLTSSDEARAFIHTTVERFGAIDVLVNNAGLAQTGVAETSDPFLDLDEAAWERAIALNLKTAFNVTRAAV